MPKERERFSWKSDKKLLEEVLNLLISNDLSIFTFYTDALVKHGTIF
jgi:hypothetical protein